MKLTVFTFMFAVTFTLVTSQCTTDQWEGVQGTTTGYSTGTVKGLSQEYSVVHFYNSKRLSSVEKVYVNQGKTLRTKTLIRYTSETSGKEYVLDLDTDKCGVKDLHTPFPKSCMPDGSTLQAEGYLGLQGGYMVYIYRGRINNMTLDMTLAPDGDKYVPVAQGVTGSVGDVDFFSGTSYMNITHGIKDMDVFNVPKPCQHAEASVDDEAPHPRVSVFGL